MYFTSLSFCFCLQHEVNSIKGSIKKFVGAKRKFEVYGFSHNMHLQEIFLKSVVCRIAVKIKEHKVLV